MKPHRPAVLAAVLAVVCTSSLAAPFPVQDLGVIDTYAVLNQPTGGSWAVRPLDFPLDVTFTLQADTDVRMDARWLGFGTKYQQGYLRDATFTVYDSEHVKVGSGVDDPTYNRAECTGDFSINGSCTRQSGLTFSGRLKAGEYTLSFEATRLDMVSPNVRIGVANLETANLPDYMVAVTPPSVPEPSQVMSMALGMLALLSLRRRKKARAAHQA